MRLPHRIVIVGAGVTGLMLAAMLSQSRRRDALEITVVDAAHRPAFSPDSDVALRVSAIATGSAALFERVGAWSALAAARVGPYESMRVWDHNEPPHGDATLRFDAAEFAVPQLGFIVENERYFRDLERGPDMHFSTFRPWFGEPTGYATVEVAVQVKAESSVQMERVPVAAAAAAAVAEEMEEPAALAAAVHSDSMV